MAWIKRAEACERKCVRGAIEVRKRVSRSACVEARLVVFSWAHEREGEARELTVV